MIGTVRIFKPEADAGLICVIIDNQKAIALGLEPVGLMNWAIWLNERREREATVQKYQPNSR
ncbi:hypothetical protein D3C76_1805420 [compost metagenome]